MNNVAINVHEHTRRCIVLKHNLMYDTGARLPELDPILTRGALQEVENFLVCDERFLPLL